MRAKSFSIWAIPVAAIAAISGWSVFQQPTNTQSATQQPAPVRAVKPAQAASTSPVKAKLTPFKIVKSFPHARDAFTEGLFWHDGAMYESTGREGYSFARRVDLQTGKVLQQVQLPKEVFGEGLVLVGDRLIQVTWQSERAFVFDAKTFKPLGEWKYQGEGWGLTTDGEEIIMSDGSAGLSFRDPKTFAEKRRVNVTFNGKPLKMLNELEWINGQVWANVWQTDYIVRINPQTGAVEEYLDCTNLLNSNSRAGKEDVLNGIAYDAQSKRIFLTGKFWPKIFEIQLQN